ncbi:MAG: phosphoribosylaminoimidazolesuccinocarboxamide synthase [Flavobacteriaceae bacterium]|nr:phosphoribosylaminoimidazolesuccinocarboxamide synthase [Flavobacteriaceae bacterium]
MNTITSSNFEFPGQLSKYKGKVRDVYELEGGMLIMIATDRLSAFDVVMPEGIPYKGQILNQIASKMMASTSDIVPNWVQSTPDPNVTIGQSCTPFKVEMVIRGYMSGHSAREYKEGKRILCGVEMPDGIIENDAFDEPIITPATKANKGHDEDISKDEIIQKNIVSESDYLLLEKYTRALFKRGTEISKSRGLILVDTKYEFGKTSEGKIVLIDEIHTPDSSRFFYADGYRERQNRGEPQKQLSKEFVRQWLISNNFQGLKGQNIPLMTKEYIKTVSDRYIELYEKIIGENFIKADTKNIDKRIEKNVIDFLSKG